MRVITYFVIVLAAITAGIATIVNDQQSDRLDSIEATVTAMEERDDR